jgi:hypothetical protein
VLPVLSSGRKCTKEPFYRCFCQFIVQPTIQPTAPAVTAEVASSSLVVPAIHSKRVERISLKPSRAQKGTFSCPYLCPFSSRSICPHSAASFGSDGCDVPFASPENTSEKIAA